MFTRMGNVKLTREQFANRVVWVKFLVSGDYPQGRSRLRTSDGDYCCLGVAADCLRIDPKLVDLKGDTSALLPGRWSRNVLGLDLDSEYSADEQLVATGWNDQAELTFEQIADRVALATEKSVKLQVIRDKAPELHGEKPGAYAREWLKRLV